MSDKVRHLVAMAGAGGSTRWYWRPAGSLRKHGWADFRLPDDEDAARAKAISLNAEVDAWRRGEPVDTSKHAARVKALADKLLPKKSPHAQGRRPADGQSGIYVIANNDTGRVKVGIARDVAGRLRQLQSGNDASLRIMFYLACSHETAVLIEKSVHQRSRDARTSGEWFRLSAPHAIRWVLENWNNLETPGFRETTPTV